MDYEAFAEQFIEKLQLNMEPEVELQRQSVTKTNGILKDGLVIRTDGAKAAPTEYIDDLYKMYQDGNSVDEIVGIVMDRLEKHKSMAPDIPELTRESAYEHLYCTVINTTDNAEMLKHVPHENLEDLSVVVRFRVGENGSFLVTDDICQTLQMTSEEVMEAAHANTNSQEYTLQTMNEIMREIMHKDGMPDEYIDELFPFEDERCPMWVLSNSSRVDGAVAITSKKALTEAYSRLGEAYYCLPSSRHEVILVPESFSSNVDDLKAMVKDINATQVDQIDRLSNSVYRFDGRSFTIADTPTMDKVEIKTENLVRNHVHSH